MRTGRPPAQTSGVRNDSRLATAIRRHYRKERFTVLDVLCVGFGPANIALAVALDELWPDASVRFLERMDGPYWQPGMLLDGADIQNNPARDLVTPRNPRSRYTFINYLHEHGRLFKALNLPGHHPLRKEYAGYVRWVAQQVPADVEYGQDVTSIEVIDGADGGRLVAVRTAAGRVLHARSVVVAPGRSANIPEQFAGLGPDRVCHTSGYLPSVADLTPGYDGTIAVVGASQSAIEVVLDLVGRVPKARLVNVISGYGYRLKDTSPFSEEVYFPEFVDYYFRASARGKQLLRDQLRPTNYSAADRDVIDNLYTLMYEDELDGRERISMLANRRIGAVTQDAAGVALELTERITGETEVLRADRVVLATGYRDLGVHEREEQLPPLLADLAGILRVDGSLGLTVDLDYRVQPQSAADGVPPIYINGLCESTHGLGDAGSFSLLALRSKAIVQSLRRALTADAALREDAPEPALAGQARVAGGAR
jgi:L-ornithine N5-oxygenase